MKTIEEINDLILEDTNDLLEEIKNSEDYKKLKNSTSFFKKTKIFTLVAALIITPISGLTYKMNHVETTRNNSFSTDIHGQIDKYNSIVNYNYNSDLPSLKEVELSSLKSGIYQNPFVDNNIATIIVDKKLPEEINTYQKARTIVKSFLSDTEGSYHINDTKNIAALVSGKDSSYHIIHIDSNQINYIKELYPENLRYLIDDYVVFHEIAHAHPQQYYLSRDFHNPQRDLIPKQLEITSDISALLKVKETNNLNIDEFNNFLDATINFRLKEYYSDSHSTALGIKLFKEHFNNNIDMYNSLDNKEQYMKAIAFAKFTTQYNFADDLKSYFNLDRTYSSVEVKEMIYSIKKGNSEFDDFTFSNPLTEMLVLEETYPFYNLNENEINLLAEKISDNYNSLHIDSYHFQHYVIKNDIDYFKNLNLKQSEIYFDAYLEQNNWKISQNNINHNIKNKL